VYVAPEHEKEAFTCPHCQVLTTQEWEDLGVPIQNRGNAPDPPRNYSTRPAMSSTPISRSTCYHYGEHCYWYDDKMLYPATVNVPMPSPDLPEDLKNDYLEARQIVTASPRGAAALLRLVLQKLLIHLAGSGKDIYTDIGSLYKKGKITERTKKILDSVRIVGNESVHPGEINLNEDPKMANALFYLINLIVLDAYSYDKYVDSIYEQLPESKRKGVEDRDRPKPEKTD
jgi:hypothetical protein